jgi:hypothetical protein
MLLRRRLSPKDLVRLREEDARRARKEEQIRKREKSKASFRMSFTPGLDTAFQKPGFL